QSVCASALKNGRQITHADFFGIGVARRSMALSAGFRTLVEAKNGIAAVPLVRIHLDTVLRLYAAYFVKDHHQFCYDVFQGMQVDRMKDDDGNLMKDGYLRDRVAKSNPWIVEVYKKTSGAVHFSNRHIFEAVRPKNDEENAEIGDFSMFIGSEDVFRAPDDYREPMRCMHHLNLIIGFGLADWFGRMCAPDGPTMDAEEYWAKFDAQEAAIDEDEDPAFTTT
ncbi:hypothetical protein CS379_19020, partial [Methylobacterium frigidaeris]